MAKSEPTLSSFLSDVALGGVAHVFTKTATAPLERVRFLLQTQDAHPQMRSGEVLKYRGAVDCALRIYRDQGLKRFWDGNVTNCVLYVPSTFFGLIFQDTFRKCCREYDPQTQFGRFFATHLVCGTMAAACTMGFTYPLDYARMRLATDVAPGERRFGGLGDCLLKTRRGGGFMGLYAGFTPAVAGIALFKGLELGTFGAIIQMNPYKEDTGLRGFLSTVAAAQAAVTFGSAFTYPFDTVRRRMMIEADLPAGERLYKGSMDCFKKVAAEKGLVGGGLYRGFSVNIATVFMLIFYDRAKTVLSQ
jgi:solute carrier family 25 (adenine nucleotide translocator) protein 4/5/6/31